MDLTLLAKPPEQLTPSELAQVQSYLTGLQTVLTQRSTDLRATSEKKAFDAIAVVAADSMTKELAWAKLPKLSLIPNADGTTYTVAYVSDAVKTKKTKTAADGTVTATRTTAGPDDGKITLNKIAEVNGGVAKYIVAGKEYDTPKEMWRGAAFKAKVEHKDKAGNVIVKIGDLEQCWEFDKKVGSISDIIVQHYGAEVSMKFQNGTTLTVADAVEGIEAARGAKAPAAPVAPAAPPAPATEVPV